MVTIGELSRNTGVNIETIRYYERIGLIPRPARTESGRRVFGPDEAERLTFIRHARELGFDVAAIRELLNLQDRPEASCEAVSRLASEHLRAVDERVTRLIRLRKELRRMIVTCSGGRIGDCRVVAALTHRVGHAVVTRDSSADALA